MTFKTLSKSVFLNSFFATERTETSEKTFLKISVNSVFSVAEALFHALLGLKKHSLRPFYS